MDPLVMLLIGGTAVAFLMKCSTDWWKAHLKEIESPHQVLECDIGITPDEIREILVYDTTPQFYAVFSTVMAMTLFTITSFEAICQFIPGSLPKLLVWMVGLAIIIFTPNFLAKRGIKKGR